MTITCAVEDKLGREASLELDIMLADPKRWPKAIFEGWQLPPGPMPATMRTWGAQKIGLEWCRARDVDVTKAQMARHIRDHVPIVPYTPEDFVVKGGDPRDKPSDLVPHDPISFLQVFQNGLRVGNKALEMLLKRVEEAETAGEALPTQLLLKLADLGAKLATSEASIRTRGAAMSDSGNDELEGFRSGSAPLPSERIGHQRIRVIDGEARPVRDEGPTDRARFNERAREEGSPTLPSP
jgi:hypothetical protein